MFESGEQQDADVLVAAQDAPRDSLAFAGRDESFVAVRLFDQFTGQGVPEGQKSLAVEVTLQPAEKSYGEDELSLISARVIAAATKLGGSLRG